MTKINSIDNKTRNSSIELLRIICMLMILIQHADFWLMGYPQEQTLRAFGACTIESASIISVNVFVLISGYFGVKFSGTKVLNLLFQCLWAIIPISLIFTWNNITHNLSTYDLFFPFRFWYITAYIGLLILSPIINFFIKNKDKKQLAKIILLLTFSALVFDMICQEESGMAFLGGYSTIWMINLYLIGRYIRLYPLLKVGIRKSFVVFLGYVVLQSVLLFCHAIGTRYTNPLLLIGSIAFFWIFTQFRFSSKSVNWIAGSALMVYLFSMHPLIINIYGGLLHKLNSNYNLPLFLVFASLLIIIMFITAILYDKIRLIIWKSLEPMLSRLVKYIEKNVDKCFVS